MDIEQAIKLAFESYNPKIQKEYHQTSKDEGIASRFYIPYTKATWYSRNQYFPMTPIKSGNSFIYEVDPRFDLLISSELVIELPEIEVTDEKYRVAWPDEVAVNICESGKLKRKNQFLQNLSSFSQEVDKNFFDDPTKRDMREKARGNDPSLIAPHSQLPKREIKFRPPFFYNDDTCLCYPILFDDKDKLTTHVMTFKRKLKDLLQVYEYVDGKWSLVPIEDKHIKQDIKSKIKIPTFRAMYVMLSVPERKRFLESCSQTADLKEIRFKEYVRLDRDGPDDLLALNDPYSIDLRTSTPCHAIFWAVENNNARKMNVYSNYTLDETNPRDGDNPVQYYNLYFDKVLVSRDKPDYRCISQVDLHASSVPIRNGFGCIFFSWYPKTACQADNSNMLDDKLKANLSLEIGDPKKKDMIRFLKVKVLALVDRKISIIKKGDKYEFELDKFE